MFSSDLVSWYKVFLENTMDFCQSVVYPGTNGLNAFDVLMIVFVSTFIIRAIRWIYGIGGSGGSHESSGGNNRRIKVSKERKDDAL